MRKFAQKSISLLLTLVMLLGMLPTTAWAAKVPSGTINAYLYYRVDGKVPVSGSEVKYNDLSKANYGPSGDNTPMLTVQIDTGRLYQKSQESNSPVEYGEPSGWWDPKWYFRPATASDSDVNDFWNAVRDCMTEESRRALKATGMEDNFICYLLKENKSDDNGYFVHMDGVLNVSTEDNTKVYVCELHDENGYFGGLVTDSTKAAAEHPKLQDVYNVCEDYFGMPSDTVWTPNSDGVSATYTDTSGKHFRVTIVQTLTGSERPHTDSDIFYKMEDTNYYLAQFRITREQFCTVTYTDGLDSRVIFSDDVHIRLYGDDVPGFTGGTPEDPQDELVFNGWDTDITGKKVTGDMVITAQWKPITYTVIWKNYDGTVLETDTGVKYGTMPTYDGAEPSKASDGQYSYAFTGWDPTPAYITGTIPGNTIIYTAQYSTSTNSYTVTWIDYNDAFIDAESVEYGESPAYRAGPSRSATPQYTYTFAGWKNTTTGTEYAPGSTLPVVTGNVTYKAQYDSAHRNYKVTLKMNLDDTLTDVADILGKDKLYIKSEGGTVREAIRKSTGIYVAEDVPNGKYNIYIKDGTEYEKICDQIINMDYADVEKVCNYYSVTYNGNGATSGVPGIEKYHLGTDGIKVATGVPIRAEYMFKGWKVDSTATILQPGAELTDDIGKAYVLTAQWAETTNVTVNVHIDHSDGGVGIDNNINKDDVTVELVWRPTDDSKPWLEVPGTKKDLVATASGSECVATVTYSGVEREGRKFNVTYDKSAYKLDTNKGTANSGITVTKVSEEEWTIDLYLKYEPSNFDLNFSVEMANAVPKELYPDAVIARVLYWNKDKAGGTGGWDIISQHDGKPGVNVEINKTDGKGTGKYSVWQQDTATPPNPYYYRFEVSAFVYGGNIVSCVSGVAPSYTDGTYTATMDAVSSSKTFGGYEGAYWDGTEEEQVGTLNAVITADSYKVTLLGNGGTFGTETSVSIPAFNMPDISGSKYKPTLANNTFAGYNWYVDNGTIGTYEDGIDTAVGAVSAGTELAQNYILVAQWNAHWTIKGTVEVAGSYKQGGVDIPINDADRIEEVHVLLQYAREGSSEFVDKDTYPVSITYTGNTGSGEFSFLNFPDDGGTWRVHVLNHNYTAKYKNEISSDFGIEIAPPDSNWSTSPNIAKDNVPVYDVAIVDVKMDFTPESFPLWYKVDASEIGSGFHPDNTDTAEVLILYNDGSAGEWPPISQMNNLDGTYTGHTGVIGSEHAYEFVWVKHPMGDLYEYSIKVKAVNGTVLNGEETYTVSYSEPVTHQASGGHKNQTAPLVAKLIPKSYPIKYYLDRDSGKDFELFGGATINVPFHKWSHQTELKAGGVWEDVPPARPGYIFTGWVDIDGNPVTSVAANVHDVTKLYAAWEVDNWKDAEETLAVDTDSPTGGDGIPDTQQIHIEYITDGHGTLDCLGEIVTLGNDYTDEVATGGTGSVPTASSNYAFDKWEYVGDSVADGVTLSVDPSTNKLIPTIGKADGNMTYTFRAVFGLDEWNDVGGSGDSSTGGDDIPDKYQAMVVFHSANSDHGTVTGNVCQVTTFAGKATSGTVTPSLTNVTVSALSGWAFDYWTKNHESTKVNDAMVDDPILVTGGTIINFYANFGTDEWNDVGVGSGDSSTGGDDIPDSKQILIRYESNDIAKGAVTLALEVVTLTGNGPEDIASSAIAGSTANPAAHNAFVSWRSNRNNVSFTASNMTIDPAINGARGGESYTFTAAFDADELVDQGKDPDPSTPGDGIPDMYQVLITFKVVDGSWNDNTKADKFECVTLMKGSKWDVDGSGSLSAPAVGDKPNGGYRAGGWDIEVPTTFTGNDAVTYTYRYARSGGGGGSSSGSSETGSVTLTKVDAADPNTKLANVYFDLYKADGTLVSSHKTGADGTITVQDLPVGEYYWIEVRTAGGYTLDSSKRPFTVSKDKTVSLTVANQMTPVPSVFSGDHIAFVSGYPDGTVRPEAKITRAEVSAIFYRLLTDDVRAQYTTNTNAFYDVEEGMWFHTAVSTMAAMGVVSGYPDGGFHPNANITRAEFAAMASRFDVNRNDFGVSFDDIYEHWAKKSINIASNNGWVLGYEDGTFKPDQLITRAEAMTMFNRVLQRVPESAADLLPGMKTWPDNADPRKWYYLSVQEATNYHDYERKSSGYERWTKLLEES